MKILVLISCLLVVACAPYKPDLDDTQIVNGKSIIIPPDFNKLPKEK